MEEKTSSKKWAKIYVLVIACLISEIVLGYYISNQF